MLPVERGVSRVHYKVDKPGKLRLAPLESLLRRVKFKNFDLAHLRKPARITFMIVRAWTNVSGITDVKQTAVCIDMQVYAMVGNAPLFWHFAKEPHSALPASYHSGSEHSCVTTHGTT